MAVVLDVFAGILINKLVNLAEEEVGMLLGVEDEVKKMKGTMEMIRNLQLDAEQNDSSNASRSSTDLVKELKDFMYDADDIIDICMMQRRQQNLPSVHSPLNCFSSCFRSLKYRHQIADDIQKLNLRMDEIIRRAEFRKTFRSVINNNNNPPLERYVHEISSIGTTLNVVGPQIEENADKLIGQIVSNGEAAGCVLFAITGMGGIGKTTLARKIFDDERIECSFPKRIWLRISKTYSEINVLKELIRNLGGSPGEAQSREELETKLASIHLPESLFLVLDDLWSSDVWYKLLNVHMNRVTTKCKILITTRDYTVALSLSSEANIHSVQKMDIDSCWYLLRKEVLQNAREEDIRQLEPVGKEIVKKCDGLPLAVKAVAGILRGKERRRVEWEGVVASDIWTMAEINDEVPRALYLSYKDLSPQLRQCFLYSSFLAINGTMLKGHLMRYWIDEGLIMDGQHVSREDKAEDYHRELMCRNLLQPHLDSLDGSICSMHDLLQSLGRFLIGGEAICIKEGKRVGAEAWSNLFKVRRLLVISEPSERLTLPTNLDPVYLRASFYKGLNFFNTRVEEGLLGRLCNLRILVLRGLRVEGLPDSLGDFLHLRHLDLDGTNIRKIPNSIGNLGNLQTLRAGSCDRLRHLPDTITRLHNLRFLDVENTHLTHMPKGIGKLRNLNTFRGLIIGHSGEQNNADHWQQSGCELQEIQNLSNLRTLVLYMLHRSRNGATTTLADKTHLKSLVLSESLHLFGHGPNLNEERIRRSQEIYNYLSPPSSLEELFISQFPAVELPTWMMSTSLADSLPNLTSLEILNAKSFRELPPKLCRLPQLKHLCISGNAAIVRIGPEFFGNDPEAVAFPKLETLQIGNMFNLEVWSSSPCRELPKLSKLDISQCRKLKALPECLSLATNLETLEFGYCPSLVYEGNLRALQNFSLYTTDRNLPEWLSVLVQQPQFKRLTLYCKAELFRNCLKDGPNWHIIGKIPNVKIEDVYLKKYLIYTQGNSV